MAKAPEAALPAEVVPCTQFVMSDAFREWAVGEMRKEVLGQVAKAGLDRMAMVKAPASAASTEPTGKRESGAQNHQSKNK